MKCGFGVEATHRKWKQEVIKNNFKLCSQDKFRRTPYFCA